jgi:protein ImuB
MLKARWSSNPRHQRTQGTQHRQQPLYTPQPGSALWLAIHRQNDSHSLEQIARASLNISDYVSLVEPDDVLVEVRSSLRYFGSIRELSRQLNQHLDAHSYCPALSPSPAASLLMARLSLRPCVRDPQQLRAALGDIPVACLPVPERQSLALQRCGLILLRDVWRIPIREIRLRFGRQLADYLQSLLALRPWVPARWIPAPHFEKSLDSEYALHSQQQILSAIQPLMQDFIDFLKQHHLLCDHLELSLSGEMSEPVTLCIQTRHASRDSYIFMLLIQQTLERQQISAAIDTIELRSRSLCQYHAASAQHSLADLLSARLGADQVLQLGIREEHAPEYVTELKPHPYKSDKSVRTEDARQTAASRQPLLLLQPPQALQQKGNKVFYLTPLEILRGPERIETRWWAGQSIRRDYYVARNCHGSNLWIFRDLNQQAGWYLHGIFA